MSGEDREARAAQTAGDERPIRVLLLDDLEDNLILRSTILRQKGYEVVTSASVEEAQERKFGGVADMHLLKGYSSVDDLLAALRGFEAKLWGRPVVVDAGEFYYSRLGLALGDDFVIEVLDGAGNWQYVNEYFAGLMKQKRQWFVGKNLFATYPEVGDELREIVRTVAETRETYIDRKFRGAEHLPTESAYWDWNVLAVPVKLHDGQDGVVLTARLMEKKGP